MWEGHNQSKWGKRGYYKYCDSNICKGINSGVMRRPPPLPSVGIAIAIGMFGVSMRVSCRLASCVPGGGVRVHRNDAECDRAS